MSYALSSDVLAPASHSLIVSNKALGYWALYWALLLQRDSTILVRTICTPGWDAGIPAFPLPKKNGKKRRVDRLPDYGSSEYGLGNFRKDNTGFPYLPHGIYPE